MNILVLALVLLLPNTVLAQQKTSEYLESLRDSRGTLNQQTDNFGDVELDHWKTKEHLDVMKDRWEQRREDREEEREANEDF